jgi:hypothetical protein
MQPFGNAGTNFASVPITLTEEVIKDIKLTHGIFIYSGLKAALKNGGAPCHDFSLGSNFPMTSSTVLP